MKVLDLCCKAGGTSMGYYLAGHEVTGVDIEPQKHYPFKFYLADGLSFLEEHGKEYDFISVSPPCQAYSQATNSFRAKGKEYPDLISAFRKILITLHKPYVIENVKRAPLINPLYLDGYMFGILIKRLRLFETNFPVIQPPIQKVKAIKMGRKPKEGDIVSPVGHFIGVPYVKKQMGIDWMTQNELAQSIPPVYTKYIIEQYENSKMEQLGIINKWFIQWGY